jgi:hypothetical protein
LVLPLDVSPPRQQLERGANAARRFVALEHAADFCSGDSSGARSFDGA